MANSQSGGPFYGADPYRSSEGLSSRPVSNQDGIQLRIDPIHGDLDEEITGLHSKISRLKNVAQDINTEAKFQNDFVTQLQMTMIQAQAGVKNNMRRLNRSIIQQGSNHLYIVIMFALCCFFLVYLYTKFSRGR
ncbi:hypothetical protein ACHQM5_001773 [Ranunculus cassubicifolius]